MVNSKSKKSWTSKPCNAVEEKPKRIEIVRTITISHSLLALSQAEIKKTITAGVKSKAMLDYDGVEQQRGIYDPIGAKKRQDDTALALRNIIMKDTIKKSKISHQKARIR